MENEENGFFFSFRSFVFLCCLNRDATNHEPEIFRILNILHTLHFSNEKKSKLIKKSIKKII
jgi:hypothetical protein